MNEESPSGFMLIGKLHDIVWMGGKERKKVILGVNQPRAVAAEFVVMTSAPSRVVTCCGSYHSRSPVALYQRLTASQYGSSPVLGRRTTSERDDQDKEQRKRTRPGGSPGFIRIVREPT